MINASQKLLFCACFQQQAGLRVKPSHVFRTTHVAGLHRFSAFATLAHSSNCNTSSFSSLAVCQRRNLYPAKGKLRIPIKHGNDATPHLPKVPKTAVASSHLGRSSSFVPEHPSNHLDKEHHPGVLQSCSVQKLRRGLSVRVSNAQQLEQQAEQSLVMDTSSPVIPRVTQKQASMSNSSANINTAFKEQPNDERSASVAHTALPSDHQKDEVASVHKVKSADLCPNEGPIYKLAETANKDASNMILCVPCKMEVPKWRFKEHCMGRKHRFEAEKHDLETQPQSNRQGCTPPPPFTQMLDWHVWCSVCEQQIALVHPERGWRHAWYEHARSFMHKENQNRKNGHYHPLGGLF